MSKPRYYLLLLLAITVGFALSQSASAEFSPAKNNPSENTLKQAAQLLAARDSLSITKDASTSIALLQRLRAGRTNEVIEVLEITLDGALTGLAYSPEEISERQIQTLRLAREYRVRFHRQQSAGVAKAFGLLNKQ